MKAKDEAKKVVISLFNFVIDSKKGEIFTLKLKDRLIQLEKIKDVELK